jgi:hypothetical protein
LREAIARAKDENHDDIMTHHDKVMARHATYLPTYQPTLPNNKETPDNPAKHKRHKRGEYSNVLLSDEEYLKLSEEWGEKELERMIKTLDEGIETKGYKYKNHYLALRKWKEKDRGTPIPKQKQEKKNCPACGKELTGLFCKHCMIQYNENLEELS